MLVRSRQTVAARSARYLASGSTSLIRALCTYTTAMVRVNCHEKNKKLVSVRSCHSAVSFTAAVLFVLMFHARPTTFVLLAQRSG